RIEGLSRAKRDVIRLQGMRAIVGMDRIDPAVTGKAFEWFPDKVDPALIDPCAAARGIGEPDENRSGVGHLPEAGLALAKGSHRLLRTLEHRVEGRCQPAQLVPAVLASAKRVVGA